MAISHDQLSTARGSLFSLLHPRGQTSRFAAGLAAGLLAGWLSVTKLSLPLWGAAVCVIGLLIYPAVRKWRLDRHRLGTPTMVLSILLVTQSLHTIEHMAQWVQYHHPTTTPQPCHDPVTQPSYGAHPPGLDTQARHDGTTTFGYSYH